LPWKELSPVQQRKAFLDACIEKEASMTELCRRIGISRKTGYKWLDRYMFGCELEDRSRRPKTSPHAVSKALEDAIVAERKARPPLGASQAAGVATACESGRAVAIREHVCARLQTQRPRRPPPPAPQDDAVVSAASSRSGTQRCLVHRLQRRLRNGTFALLPVDDHRCVQPLPHRMRCVAEYAHGDGPPGDAPRVRRVRAADGDTFRQRPAIRLRRRHWVSRSSRSGGVTSESTTSESTQASLSKTVATSGCT
jgi:transposase-like protein